MIFIGEAWQLEEDWEGRGTSSPGHAQPPVTTVGHMDQALLPQKHYFQMSPSHHQPTGRQWLVSETDHYQMLLAPIICFCMQRPLKRL